MTENDRFDCQRTNDAAYSPILNNHDSACAITQPVDGVRHQYIHTQAIPYLNMYVVQYNE